MKKILSFTCVVFLVCSSLSVVVSAADTTVNNKVDLTYFELPFPNPTNFLEDGDFAVVFKQDTSSGNGFYIQMWVVQPYFNDLNVNYTYTFSYNNSSPKTSIDIYPSEGGTHCSLTRYYYYFSYNSDGSLKPSSSYSVEYISLLGLEKNDYWNGSFWTYSRSISCDENSIMYYGQNTTAPGNVNYSSSRPECTYVYSFNDEVSASTIREMCEDIGSIKLYTNNTLSKLKETNLILNKILSALGSPDSANSNIDTSSADNFSNAVDDLDTVENDLLGTANNGLENFNSQISENMTSLEGSNYEGAFSFITDTMNFLTGNSSKSTYTSLFPSSIAGSVMGTAGYNSMSKIRTTIFITLSVGVISLILGLVNRKKE